MTNDEFLLVTRKESHSTVAVFFGVFGVFCGLIPNIQNNHSLFEDEKGLFWKGILALSIFNKGETLKEHGTILR